MLSWGLFERNVSWFDQGSVQKFAYGDREKKTEYFIQRNQWNFMIGLYIYIYKLLWSLYKPCHNFVSGSNKLEEEKGRTF